MKKDILKIAGVKSEKEFYEKYPTEEAFMKAHGKAFKKAAMGKSMVNKQLTQLTDFSNPPIAQVGTYIGGESTSVQPFDIRGTFDELDYTATGKTNATRAEEARMAKLYEQDNSQSTVGIAKRGGNIRKAYTGNPPSWMQLGPQLTTLDPQTGNVTSATGSVSQGQTQMLDSQFYANQQQQPGQQQPQQSSGQKSLATTAGGKLVDKAASMAGPFAKPLGQVINAGRKINQSIKRAAQTRQSSGLADLALEASSIRPEETQRKYVRPEDMQVQPGQIGNPYGSGTNFLQAQDGASMIGGNPTEIQNIYNPGNIYSDLGYEPLGDSSKVKQYKKGGKLKQAEGGFNLDPNLANQIGQGTQIAGDVVSGLIDMGTEKRMKQTQQTLGQTAFQQGTQSLQNQYGSFMKDGGGLKYLSNDWQPQVITKFGDYDLKDLLKPPHDADMLRAGGEIRSNYMGDDEKLSMMQMGGELQTYWGGDAETISENPYLPDGGETVMFRGQSHEEADGKGRTGIGITFGQNPVEVERGEPAVKLKDGGTGEDSLIVYGNMKIPSYGVSELDDPKAKGKKFKHYASDLSKLENKANKTSDKALKLIDDIDGDNPFDLLKLNTGKAMLQGADDTLKQIAYKKNILAGVQSAILDTAEEMGLESDSLAKGKIKPAKDSDMAKFGAKMETAQKGKKQKSSIPINIGKPTAAQLAAEDEATRIALGDVPLQPFDSRNAFMKQWIAEHAPEKFESLTVLPTAAELTEMEKRKAKSPLFDKAVDAYNDLYPYIKPGIENPLDPNQLMGEMYALATNQQEPVYAQTYTPILEEAPSVSFQDQLNEIQAQTNAAMRLAGNNPAAQATIAAQASAAKNKVLAEQFRTNQSLQLETKRRNIASLNDATLKNFSILGQQQQLQSQAKSATKAQAYEALTSIAEKIGKNKSETFAANVMANMYPQFSYGPQGRIYSTGLANWNIPSLSDYTSDELQKFTDAKKVEESKKKKRNGSIVKAIKNL